MMTDWRKLLLDRCAPADVDAMTDMVDLLFDALKNGEPIDLHGLNPNTVNGEQLALTLRATYSAQEAVPGWAEALAVAAIALAQVNIEPKDALLGLNVPWRD